MYLGIHSCLVPGTYIRWFLRAYNDVLILNLCRDCSQPPTSLGVPPLPFFISRIPLLLQNRRYIVYRRSPPVISHFFLPFPFPWSSPFSLSLLLTGHPVITQISSTQTLFSMATQGEVKMEFGLGSLIAHLSHLHRHRETPHIFGALNRRVVRQHDGLAVFCLWSSPLLQHAACSIPTYLGTYETRRPWDQPKSTSPLCLQMSQSLTIDTTVMNIQA